MEVLQLVWDRWREDVPIAQLGLTPIFIMLVASLVAVSVRQLWGEQQSLRRLNLNLRLIVTAVHEAGHAVVGLLLGRRLHGISLHGDMSGVTVSSGRGRLPMIPVSLAGYLAPAVVGSALLWSASTGHSAAALIVLGLGFFFGIFFMRNITGLAVTIGSTALLAYAVYAEGSTFRVLLAAGLGIFLNIGAVRAWIALAYAHYGPRGDGGQGSDAWQLRQLTLIPATFWLLVFIVGIVACLVFSFGTLVKFLGV